MKRIILFSLLLFACGRSYSYEITETEKIASLCKVWGFLKYFHPAVSNSSIDWDSVFVSEVKAIAPLTTSEAVSEHFITLIHQLGDIKQYPVQKMSYDTTSNSDLPLGGLQHTRSFSPALLSLFDEIAVHRIGTGNRFVKRDGKNARAPRFINEPVYESMIFPAKEYRLLSVARYWNTIQYFFPYKQLTDQPWDDVLTEMIPKCADAKDTLAYHRALTEMVAKVNDSHANLIAAYKSNLPRYFIPVRVKIIDDKAIVTGMLNDSLATAGDLQQGDVILAINDTTVKERVGLIRKYIGASNEAVLRRNAARLITSGSSRECRIIFDRNGTVTTRTINRYAVEELKLVKDKDDTVAAWKIIDNNIGLVNMGKIKGKQVNKALKELKDTKAIIFDLRNYPNWTIYQICHYLSKDKHPFVKFVYPDYSYPGAFVSSKATTYGSGKDRGYKGKIVILINEDTQSQAEFTAMALKTLPNAICIGSQTAGADGNVATITLPGNYKTYMTSLGVYYPDGTPTQRVGIVPDIRITPTIDGIRQHRDEVLERGINYINNAK